MIIATAGHVDHGKTTLLQAITGVNADRLPEEKSRGMTIDLGYAYWPQPDGRVLGFIDVPGHEKFLSNMLAGVGGIDHALLVVACDDGVMAQTREHLAILQLTGKPSLTVALTKADRVEAQRVEEVRGDVTAVLAEFGFTDATLFATAATENQGIAELREHLLQLSARAHPQHQRFRLAIDRAFTVKGAGLVVTGTALSGEVNVGDTLWLTGVDKPMRVRGLHAQNQAVGQAWAGQRIALNIVGDAQKEALNRGDWLLSVRPPEASERVIVELQCHTPLTQWQSLHIHHAASHITGRVSLLEGDLAELVLDTPLWLADNDRLVLRDISARVTLAGARVVTLNPPRRGKRKPEYLQWLASLAQARDDNAALRVHLERGAVSLSDFAWARQLSGEGLRQLTQEPGFIQAGDSLLNAPVAAQWQRKILNTLATYHEQHQDEPGPGRERLRRMALPMEDDALVLLLHAYDPKRCMIFCNTKDMTARLCDRLKKAGYQAECLHGDVRQSFRDKVMSGFRKGEFEILVATDVAARGIDVDDVEAVFNYDLPDKQEFYVHRIGRTGRAKRAGVSFSFVSFRDSIRMDEILKYIDSKPISLVFDDFGTLCYKEDGTPFLENA